MTGGASLARPVFAHARLRGSAALPRVIWQGDAPAEPSAGNCLQITPGGRHRAIPEPKRGLDFGGGLWHIFAPRSKANGPDAAPLGARGSQHK